MTVEEKLGRLGRWQLTLDVDQDTWDRLDAFGHVVITDAPASDPLGDRLLADPRYVGVLLDFDDTRRTIGGAGLRWWAGDHDGKGRVYDTEQVLNDVTLTEAVNQLVPPSIGVGNVSDTGSTYTGAHRYVTPRKVLDQVTETVGAEWRLRTDPTAGLLLDAGDSLYPADPTAVLAAGDGVEPSGLVGVDGELATDVDFRDWATAVILLAEGSGANIKTADASVGSVPYKGLRGNDVQVTATVSESDTAETVADVRAQQALDEHKHSKVQVDLTLSDYRHRGQLAVGNDAWVYDPEVGFADPSETVRFQGRVLHPTRIRIVGMSWPVTAEMGVYYRSSVDGEWVDLTDHVRPESREVTVTVGELDRQLVTVGEPDQALRQSAGAGDDGGVPAAPTLTTPFNGGVYNDSQGKAFAYVTAVWSRPDNQDGSPVSDGDRFEVDYRRTGESEWATVEAAWDRTSVRVEGLPTSVEFEFRVRAVDQFGNTGPYSSVHTQTTAADTISPDQPSAPTVSGSTLKVTVGHDLTDAGGDPLDVDLAHLEVHFGASSGFAAGPSTLEGRVVATGQQAQAGGEASATVSRDPADEYVRVVAVDQSGNRSSQSPSTFVSSQQVDTPDLAPDSVTNEKVFSLEVGKLTAGTIDATSVGVDTVLTLEGTGVFRSATSGARVEITQSAEDRIRFYNSNGVLGSSIGMIDPFNTDRLVADSDLQVNGQVFANVLDGDELIAPDADITELGVTRIDALNYIRLNGTDVALQGSYTTGQSSRLESAAQALNTDTADGPNHFHSIGGHKHDMDHTHSVTI